MRRLVLLVIIAAFAATTAFAQSMRWGQVPGTATDISIAPNGDVWIVGTDNVGGGHGIYRFDGSKWIQVPGGATRISAGPQGPWVTNAAGSIYRGDGKGGWQQMPGSAWDIGVGADGSVWVIGTNAEAGGFGIYRWNAGKNNWDKVPGSAERIAVDPKGNAVVVNKAKEIFFWVPMMAAGVFAKAPGAALDVGIGSGGTIYIVGTDHAVYQWTGNNWVKREGTFDTIAVDPKGSPWAIDAKREIYAAGRAALPGDVTAKLENLGIANNGRYANRIFARNPWDMKAYKGKIYIGSGNSNNSGPDSNAGPVDVTYFDPATNKFGSEWQVNDEQIDRFKIVGGTLTIPGHDPRESWAKGNFYRRTGENQWQQIRTVDYAIHMYDIIERTEAAAPSLSNVDRGAFGGKYLFAAIGTPTGGEVAVSGNDGKSWTSYSVSKWPGARARTFLSTPSALCVSAHTDANIPVVSLGNAVPFTSSAWLVTSKGVAPAAKLFPGMSVQHMFAAKAETFNGEAYYFGAYAPIDHNWKSEGMFATRDCQSVRRVNVPGKWFHHILAEGATLYVVTSDEEPAGRRNHLFASSDGSNFKEVLNFSNRGFARSFAILNGDFYFAIGSEAEAPVAETGTILRLRAANLPK